MKRIHWFQMISIASVFILSIIGMNSITSTELDGSFIGDGKLGALFLLLIELLLLVLNCRIVLIIKRTKDILGLAINHFSLFIMCCYIVFILISTRTQLYTEMLILLLLVFNIILNRGFRSPVIDRRLQNTTDAGKICGGILIGLCVLLFCLSFIYSVFQTILDDSKTYSLENIGYYSARLDLVMTFIICFIFLINVLICRFHHITQYITAHILCLTIAYNYTEISRLLSVLINISQPEMMRTAQITLFMVALNALLASFAVFIFILIEFKRSIYGWKIATHHSSVQITK
jgi:hypothetical protein